MKRYILVLILAVAAFPACAGSTAARTAADIPLGGSHLEAPRTATGKPTPLNGYLAQYYRDESEAQSLPQKTTETMSKGRTEHSLTAEQ
jgi:hypothetical protein